MKSLKWALLGAAGLLIAGCAGPEATIVRSGVAAADSRIKYSISKYVEPYSIFGLDATHVLRANMVRVDRSGNTIYIGLPDGVRDEFISLVRSVCAAEGKGVVDAYEDRNAQTQKYDTYFTCG